MDWSKIPEQSVQKLKSHQKECIERALGPLNGRALITMKMGAGKTFVACICCYMMHKQRSLIICPVAVVENWKREFKEITGSDLIHKKLNGELPVGISLATVTETKMWLERGGGKTKLDCVVVDEAHCLKGPSLQSKRIVPLLQKAVSCILVTGTPILNQPSELFNLLHALHPRIFDSRIKWTERFCNYKVRGFGKMIEKGVKAGKKDELHRLVRDYSCNPVIKDELRPICRHLKEIPSAHFKEQLAALRREGYEISARADKASDSWEADRLTNETKAHALYRWERAGHMKADLLATWLQHLVTVQHADDGIAIFCHHLEVAEKVHAAVRLVVPDTIYASSETPHRETYVNKLATGEVRVGVLTTGTCGTGINLTPNVSVIVIFELPHVPGIAEQVECRAHRMNQTKEVHTYWCVLQDSQDVQVLKNLQEKKETCSAVMKGQSQFFNFKE